MRVLHYSQHALVGQTGVANSARGWASALAQQGVVSTLVVDRALANLDDPAGVTCVRLPHRRLGPITVPRGLADHVAAADVVVLHGGWHPGNTAAAAVTRRVGTPYVVLSHGVYSPAALERSRWKKLVWGGMGERWMLRNALAIHLLFADERDGLTRMGVDRPAVVAPNGVTPAPVAWDGGSGDYLFYLGRYDVRHKGLDILLAGLAAVPSSTRPRLRLHGPGTAGEREEVATLVADLGLEASVELGEPIYGDDKWELFRRARGFVLTSRWEGSPMSLAEAAAVGVPTLTTPFAMGRWLADRGATICVDPTPGAVAEGLQRLASGDVRTVGERAWELAHDELDWDRVATSWIEQIRPLLAGTG